MDEWNGVKVGALYKRTGKGSRGAPLMMVVQIESAYGADVFHNVRFLESGVLTTHHLYDPGAGRVWGPKWGEAWPYKAVGV